MRSQKQMILDVIRSSHEHMTADQIYMAAKQENPGIAMGTVYRNLSLLVDAGEIVRVERPGEATRFDKTLKSHEHIVCQRCGSMKDVQVEKDLLVYLRERTGEDVLRCCLTMEYICPDCREKENELKN